MTHRYFSEWSAYLSGKSISFQNILSKFNKNRCKNITILTNDIYEQKKLQI